METVGRQVKRQLGLSGNELYHACYLLTTYVIEKRAEELYPLYESLLQAAGCSFSLEEIIREETQHLKLIARLMSHVPGLEALIPPCRDYEGNLFFRWLTAIAQDTSVITNCG
jgi:hypothetical protein